MERLFSKPRPLESTKRRISRSYINSHLLNFLNSDICQVLLKPYHYFDILKVEGMLGLMHGRRKVHEHMLVIWAFIASKSFDL